MLENASHEDWAPYLTALEQRTVLSGNEVALWIFAPNKVAHSLGMAVTPTQLT